MPSPEVAAALDFGRALVDAEFRRQLGAAGAGTYTVVVAIESTPVRDVAARVLVASGGAPEVLVAVRRPVGFGVLEARVLPTADRATVDGGLPIAQALADGRAVVTVSGQRSVLLTPRGGPSCRMFGQNPGQNPASEQCP